MTQTLRIVISTSAVSLLACSGFAQETSTPRSQQPTSRGDRAAYVSRMDRLNQAAKASDIIGMTVHNYQNEKLGEVDDLAVDVESGRIVQVILSTGGFIGIGDTLTAVPPGALHHDVANKVLHLEANQEKLKNAPKFEMANWAQSGEVNQLSQVYRYYGQESAFRFIDTEKDAALKGQLNTDGSPHQSAVPKADGNWEKSRVSGDRHTMIPVSRLGQLQRATKLMGQSVKNLQDETLGEVKNLLLDLPSGRIVAIVVSTGGFLGLGDELSAIPPTALRFTADREVLQLNASKEMLNNAPHFKANQWPDFTQPTYSAGVYRAYQVEPYFSTNTLAEPDNSKRNIRDRNDQTLTPLDQGNSQADLDTTAQIRKQIVAGKNMSVNAKNVKIITNQGQVTLRGPVDTAEEKGAIGEIANQVAKLENVNNQLEVK